LQHPRNCNVCLPARKRRWPVTGMEIGPEPAGRPFFRNTLAQAQFECQALRGVRVLCCNVRSESQSESQWAAHRPHQLRIQTD
jgi:hypothetical protein